MTTQKQVREAFWEYLKEVDPKLYAQGKKSKGQNEQVDDIRFSFIDYVEWLGRDGVISDKLKTKVTL